MKTKIYNLPNITPAPEKRRGWHTSKTATKRGRFLCPQRPPRTPLTFTAVKETSDGPMLIQVVIRV